jgi:hypothetical protein
MRKDRETFLHWPHRALGDTPAEHASRALLRRLFSQRRLFAPRAQIYRNAPGFRQALSIDVGQSGRNASALQRMRSCWLVEQHNRQLFLYASEAAPVVGAIGGTSLHDRAVLEPSGVWVQRAAECVFHAHSATDSTGIRPLIPR